MQVQKRIHGFIRPVLTQKVVRSFQGTATIDTIIDRIVHSTYINVLESRKFIRKIIVEKEFQLIGKGTGGYIIKEDNWRPYASGLGTWMYWNI